MERGRAYMNPYRWMRWTLLVLERVSHKLRDRFHQSDLNQLSQIIPLTPLEI